jgi:hypothetical protein
MKGASLRQHFRKARRRGREGAGEPFDTVRRPPARTSNLSRVSGDAEGAVKRQTARRAIRERATAVRAIGDRRSDARTQVLSRCGHWPTLERPQDVNAALRDF